MGTGTPLCFPCFLVPRLTLHLACFPATLHRPRCRSRFFCAIIYLRCLTRALSTFSFRSCLAIVITQGVQRMRVNFCPPFFFFFLPSLFSVGSCSIVKVHECPFLIVVSLYPLERIRSQLPHVLYHTHTYHCRDRLEAVVNMIWRTIM